MISGCETLDLAWSKVETNPNLPVEHGVQVEITLTCPADHVKKGGNKATCNAGKLVPTTTPPQCSPIDLEGFDNLASAKGINITDGGSSTVTGLNDLSLSDSVTGMEFTCTFTLPGKNDDGDSGGDSVRDSDRWGIYKVILYTHGDNSLDGWMVESEFTDSKVEKTSAQSNSRSEKIACEARDDEKDSTESRNFFCPPRTAATVVHISGSGGASKLAEVVIAGNHWDNYPCDKGYFNTGTGNHATTGQDCQICPDGQRNHQRGQTNCEPCDNSSRNIYYTNSFDHKVEENCQVCLDYTVANDDKTSCLECPAGEEFRTDQCDVEFDAAVQSKVEACTTLQCTACVAGSFRTGAAAKNELCQNCSFNQYSSAGAVECTACEKHKHAAPGSELCSECKGKTFEDVNDKDVPDLGDGEQLWKCFQDTGVVCVSTTAIVSIYGTYDPKWVKLGSHKVLDCTYDCQKGSKEPCKQTAIFFCEEDDDGQATFRVVYNCIRTSLTEHYEKLLNEEKENSQKSEDFKEFAVQNSEKSGLGDLEMAADILDSMVAHENDAVNAKIVANTVEGVSSIINGYLPTNASETRDIFNRVVGSLSNMTSSSTDSNDMAKSKHIATIKVNGSNSTTSVGGSARKFSLPAKDSSLESLTEVVETDLNNTFLMVSAEDDMESKEIAIVIFQQSKLFPNTITSTLNRAQMKDNLTAEDYLGEDKPMLVNSLVVDIAAVKDTDKPYSLSLYMKPLTNVGDRNESITTFPDGTKKQLRNRCHSFNTTSGKWREDCETLYNENDPSSPVMCLCAHNTSFAVLMSPYEIDPGYIESQTLMSISILSVSVLCLVLTIALLLPAAPLRKQRSTNINICFSFSLLLASILFLLQNVLVKSDNSGVIALGSAGCTAYAAVQHYLWLVVFLWMVVEGILMYLSLVQVFGSHISKYMLKFNLLCWGVPIPFPIIGYFAFTKTVTVGDYSAVKSDYIADNMCFLKPGGLPFWILFFVPLVLALLANLVFLVLVLKVIKDSNNAQVSERELLMRQIKAAVGVMSLLGTGWIVGVFMTIPEPNTQITLQYIFILLNSSQGIMVFICYVALNKQVTDHWLTKFGMKKNVAANSGNNSANTKSSSCNQQDSAANSKTRAENVYENRIVVEGCTRDVTPL